MSRSGWRPSFYLYGELTNAVGKNNPNIHLDTQEYGILRIELEKDYLKDGEKTFFIRSSVSRPQAGRT